MTVLLMLCMIVTFLAADGIVQRARAAKRAPARAGAVPAPAGPPPGFSIAQNHTWMNVEEGVAVIGIDEFLTHLAGAIESVILPDVGAAVSPQGTSIALASGTRRLRLASPVAGRILEVNRGILEDPGIARQDPYRGGWLMKVAPDLSRSVPARTGAQAREWIRAEMAEAREFLTGSTRRASLASLPDGGEVAEGALLHLDAVEWGEFERRFATLPEAGSAFAGRE